jgi:hypothetical protein
MGSSLLSRRYPLGPGFLKAPPPLPPGPWVPHSSPAVTSRALGSSQLPRRYLLGPGFLLAPPLLPSEPFVPLSSCPPDLGGSFLESFPVLTVPSVS